ncbi:MAG: hypothetical protein K0R62_8112, partial [Nonomuraea muscovyensis]|nr:hypothetical protein [Nonomuraea muscovyensis]
MDTAGTRPRRYRVANATPPGGVQTALADQGFKSSVAAHGATHGIDVQIV